MRHDIPQVSEESELLTASFSEEETKAAVFDTECNKALGPDGFPTKFY